MKRDRSCSILTAGLAALLIAGSFPIGADAETAETENTDDSSDEYSLVWSDEFDGDSLNTNDWNVEQHEPGWVNAELQRYTSLDEGNLEVSDGVLHINPHVTEPEEVTENESSNEESSTDTPAEEKVTNINFDVTVGEDKPTSETIALQVNFGKIDDSTEGTSQATVELFDLSLTDKETGEQLLRDISFSEEGNWSCGITSPAEGTYSFENGRAIISINNSGDANWNIQLQQGGLKIESGHTYEFSMNATSTTDRMTEISLIDPENGYNWYGGSKEVIEGSGSFADTNQSQASASQLSQREVTSARITTQGLHDFTYGRFEARAKVPEGKGYLPAFWLMATDEGLYGQWPKCGEIDIMEVMGQDTSKSYHTIHYGYNSGNGHKQNQGSKYLNDPSFSDDYHIFRVDWEPDSITWYVDDEQVYTTNDWYTGQDDDSQLTYPAPFDQNFYVILNLAVGGSWVGYPDDSVYEHMNNDEFAVDYVRVYQKSEEAYREAENNAHRPDQEPITYREPDESGNYVINGDFAKDIAIEGSATATKDNWKLHLESDASATTYEVKDNSVKITPSATGSQNHSIQLKQESIPMYKGWEYELTFDAVASEDRNIVIDVEGPDRGWIRYMNDTTALVTTDKKSYSYTFTMSEKTDPNASLEFNLGKQNSTVDVTISNVRLTHKSGETIQEDGSKVIRPDGNYIYNGKFDQGDNRLAYWEINNPEAVSVTNEKNSRMLRIAAPEGTSTDNPIVVSQSNLSPIAAGQYELSFDGYAENTGNILVDVAGQSLDFSLTATSTKYSKKILIENSLDRESSYVKFVITSPGVYTIDNAFFTDAAILKNGSFNAGLSGFTPYIYDTVKANYVIDNMNGNDNAFAITIEDTMADTDDNCWYVQLNQDGINLEKGKSYRVSFRAKSSIDRVIKYSLQEFEGNWTNYSGTGSVEIGNEWKTFSHEFTMESESDSNTRFNITLGSVDGVRIRDKHDVYIDDIELIEIESPGSATTENPGGAGAGQGPNYPSTDDPSTGNSDDPSTGSSETPPENPAQGPSDDPSDEPSQKPSDDPSQQPSDNPSSGDSEIDEPSTPEINPGQGNTPKPNDKPHHVSPIVVVHRVIKRTIQAAVKTIVNIFKSIFRFF